MRHRALALAGLCLALGAGQPAAAQGRPPVKVGMITTLSGPGSYLGEEVRDGFQLALDLKGGSLGGVPVQLVVEDDGGRPQRGTQIADRMLKSEGIKLFTGILYSNINIATSPEIVEAGALFLSPNSSPSQLAGKDCHAKYFALAWQNDNSHEAAGQTASNLGFKRAFAIVPNFQGGKDALAGFKRYFKGELIGEVFTRLDQTDFAAEIAQVRAAKPDVLYQFQPGGLGITFLRQYQQSGLQGQIPMVLSASSIDEVTIRTVGPATEGLYVTSHWFPDFDNEASRTFVQKFTEKFGRKPTYYASQSYDVAQAIGAGLAAAGGDVAKIEQVRSGILSTSWSSVRGPFKFGPNQHPVQDWFMGRVERGADGVLGLVTKEKVLPQRADAYAGDCKL